jgi:hypothetical protein
VKEQAAQIQKVSARLEINKTAPQIAAWQNSPLFEIARVLVRVDHAASFIVNANHSIM